MDGWRKTDTEKTETERALQQPPVNPVILLATRTEAENSRLARDFILS